MSALEKLSDIIDLKDEKISELEEEIEKLKWWANKNNYFRPSVICLDEALPAPRLEIKLIIHSDFEHEWQYALIYHHLSGKIMSIPMGQTFSRGGHKHDKYETVEQVMSASPFRLCGDIRHDSEQFNFPAYAIVPTGRFLLPHLSRGSEGE